MSGVLLSSNKTGLLVIDVQERLFPHIHHHDALQREIVKMIKGARILGLPIYATAQYPDGLGNFVPPIREALGAGQKIEKKTRFSAADAIDSHIKNWIIVGIEAHICVLQTVKELHKKKRQVICLVDGIGSRSKLDFEVALRQMEQMSVCLSTVETVLFELMGDASCSNFKEISSLCKET